MSNKHQQPVYQACRGYIVPRILKTFLQFQRQDSLSQIFQILGFFLALTWLDLIQVIIWM